MQARVDPAQRATHPHLPIASFELLRSVTDKPAALHSSSKVTSCLAYSASGKWFSSAEQKELIQQMKKQFTISRHHTAD